MYPFWSPGHHPETLTAGATEQVRLVLSEAQERWLDEHFDTMSKQYFAEVRARVP